MMKRQTRQADWGRVFARVCLVGGLTWLLALSPTPQALRQARLEYARAVQAGAPALAAKSLESAAFYEPWREDFGIAAARYRLQAGDLASVVNSLDRPQVLAAFTGEDWLRLGDAKLEAGDPSSAEAAWQQGLQAGGAALELHDRLHHLYHQQGDYQAALEVLRAAHIRVAGQEVGGTRGRRIRFNTQTGEIECRFAGDIPGRRAAP